MAADPLDDDAYIDFEVFTDRVAGLRIHRDTPGPFGLTSLDTSAVPKKGRCLHGVGSRATPMLLLHEPWSSDEEWALETNFVGLLGLAASKAVAWEKDYEEWAVGTAAPRVQPVLKLLPTGMYYLVQTPRRPEPTKRVMLGNGWHPATPNTLLLVEADRAKTRKLGLGVDFSESPYAAIIGPGVPHDQALVGVVILRSQGGALDPQVLFCCATGATSAAQPDGDGDLVLIIPASGELIIDAARDFGGEAKARERWAKKAIFQLMAHLGINVLADDFVRSFGSLTTWAR